MELHGLLPIGSVVLLANSTKRVMIIGVAQKGGKDPEYVWDYAGVVFPEGYISGDNVLLFDNRQIVSVYMIGLQDTESLTFKEKADQFMDSIRSGKTPEEANEEQ